MRGQSDRTEREERIISSALRTFYQSDLQGYITTRTGTTIITGEGTSLTAGTIGTAGTITATETEGGITIVTGTNNQTGTATFTFTAINPENTIADSQNIISTQNTVIGSLPSGGWDSTNTLPMGWDSTNTLFADNFSIPLEGFVETVPAPIAPSDALRARMVHASYPVKIGAIGTQAKELLAALSPTEDTHLGTGTAQETNEAAVGIPGPESETLYAEGLAILRDLDERMEDAILEAEVTVDDAKRFLASRGISF